MCNLMLGAFFPFVRWYKFLVAAFFDSVQEVGWIDFLYLVWSLPWARQDIVICWLRHGLITNLSHWQPVMFTWEHVNWQNYVTGSWGKVSLDDTDPMTTFDTWEEPCLPDEFSTACQFMSVWLIVQCSHFFYLACVSFFPHNHCYHKKLTSRHEMHSN